MAGIDTDEADLPIMIFLEARPVRDIEDRRPGKVGSEEFHDLSLARVVQSRCGLIHDDDVGRVDQEARKCKPLLFAR